MQYFAVRSMISKHLDRAITTKSFDCNILRASYLHPRFWLDQTIPPRRNSLFAEILTRRYPFFIDLDMRKPWRALGSALFDLQQRLLSLHTPAIAAHAAVLADYAVAGNRDRHWIGGAGTSHGASGTRLTDSFRHSTVGLSSAKRNRLQICPHASLECCGTDVQG